MSKTAPLKVAITELPGVLVLAPRVFRDARGFFFESYNAHAFSEHAGLRTSFVQDNHSRSRRGTLRGLHYQIRQPQGKLVRVATGAIYDVAVDLRRDSPSFGHWTGVHLSARNRRQLWIPPGFAHGFLVTSATADVLYKATDFYAPAFERCIRWDDPTLAIRWPDPGATIVVSDKDAAGVPFRAAETYPPTEP